MIFWSLECICIQILKIMCQKASERFTNKIMGHIFSLFFVLIFTKLKDKPLHRTKL